MKELTWESWAAFWSIIQAPSSFPLKPSSVLENVFDVMYHNCCRIFAWATTHRVLAASGNTRVKQVVAAAVKATSTVPSPPLKSATTAVLLLLQLLAHWILSRLSSQHVLRLLLLVLSGQRCAAVVCVLQFHSFFHRMCLRRSSYSAQFKCQVLEEEKVEEIHSLHNTSVGFSM